MGKEKSIPIGTSFGRLKVLARHFPNQNHRVMWLCQCSCGRQIVVDGISLRAHNRGNCGCRNHGHSRTKLYCIWKLIVRRCCNAKSKRYKDYGGRGITICERWRKSFLDFLADVGPRPSPKHSIDRIDNDGNYEPRNVRWATDKIQANNSRANHFVTCRGETQTISQWAEISGRPSSVISWRLRQGWSAEDAIFLPRQKTGPKRKPKPLSFASRSLPP